MNNEPVAWMFVLDGCRCVTLDEDASDEVRYNGTPLYTHQYERPHNTVLVPCDKLAEMQAEIEALKEKVQYWIGIADRERARADRNEQ